MENEVATITEHFKTLADPRIEKKCDHLLIDILVIALCGTICGADGWVSIEKFGKSKHEWLKTFLELPNGIPSHDTFGNVFAMISPTEFQQCFLSWVNSIAKLIEGEVIAIDGKTARGSRDHANKKKPMHMVSAWATQNRIVLGQTETSEKSNEITAIPELLRVLDLKGCIVTIDAMGCQKEIAEQIIEKEADYILALKGNQGNLHKSVEQIFTEADDRSYTNISVDYDETRDKSHGRDEIRRCWTTDSIEEVANKDAWKGLKTIGMIESQRTEAGIETIEHRYFISSLENNAKLFLSSVRDHWGVENSLHWKLDVGFREDSSRIRKDNAPANLTVLRHIALNLLDKEKTAKVGTQNKRLMAGWNNGYLYKVLKGLKI